MKNFLINTRNWFFGLVKRFFPGQGNEGKHHPRKTSKHIELWAGKLIGKGRGIGVTIDLKAEDKAPVNATTGNT